MLNTSLVVAFQPNNFFWHWKDEISVLPFLFLYLPPSKFITIQSQKYSATLAASALHPDYLQTTNFLNQKSFYLVLILSILVYYEQLRIRLLDKCIKHKRGYGQIIETLDLTAYKRPNHMNPDQPSTPHLFLQLK